MVCKNTTDSFGSVAKLLHWTVAIMVIGLLILGHFMPNEFLHNVHKTIGILVLFLMLFRFFWRLNNVQPDYEDEPPVFKAAAFCTHWLLYLLLIIMPLSGWLMATAAGHVPHFMGLFYWPFPGIEQGSAVLGPAHQIHETVAWIIIALLVAHVLAAIYHHTIKRNNVLKRMLPCKCFKKD